MTHQNKVNLTSSNLSDEKLAELRRILPEAFSENKIDWEKLRTVLGDEIDSRIEKFNFSWAGKSTAIKNVLIPSVATLRPVKDESVKFDESENLFIEGDNLEVLKLLQKAYFEKVKMIYIDPPYNTGGDFVYHDDFAAPVKNYLQQTGQVDAEGNKLETNKETNGRYHSDWLSMMYPRLKLAWNLLKNDGVIFVSIDDNEVHHLRMIMNEIFGEENSLTKSPTALIWQRSGTTAGHFANAHEYILVYAKNKTACPFFSLEDFGEESKIQDRAIKKVSKANPISEIEFPAGIEFDGQDATFEGEIGGSEKQYINGKMIFKSGKLINPVTIKAGWAMREQILSWINGEETFDTKDQRISRFYFNAEGILWYEKERGTIHPRTLLPKEVGTTKTGSSELEEIFGIKIFDFPKPSSLIKYLVSFTTKEDQIILDFFAGTGTTAHSVMAQNAEDGGHRKWISVQLPEKIVVENPAYKAGYKTIADIAKERIRRAAKMIEEEVAEKRGTHNGLKEVYGYKEGQIKELQAEETGYRFDFDDGFKVFKLTESNYPENNFEFDPAKSEAENKEAFELYLGKAKQTKLFDVDKTIDVVYENIVKEGFSLNSKITESKVGKNKVYTVVDSERQFLVCLDKLIDDVAVSELTSKAYKGKMFICLDNALDDTAKANLGLNVELKTI